MVLEVIAVGVPVGIGVALYLGARAQGRELEAGYRARMEKEWDRLIEAHDAERWRQRASNPSAEVETT